MNLSLDYDNTYTRDPIFWNTFIDIAKRHGHTVYCVTLRTEEEGKEVHQFLGDRVEAIYCTGRENKHDFMFKRWISIDVWIDDMPYFIMNNARDFTDATKSEG